MSDLSILCVTKYEPHAAWFLAEMSALAEGVGAEFVVAIDGAQSFDDLHGIEAIADVVLSVKSAGYIESVLDKALNACSRDYILRLDDDERCSRAMVRWLRGRAYETGNHWKFSRVHLLGSSASALVTPHLWPDHQTRLSSRKLSGGRSSIHAGSPYGGGLEASCSIEHHKFLVKTIDQRRAIIARYDQIQEGAGSRFRAFSCPEDFYAPEELTTWLRAWDGESLTRIAA